MADADLYKRPSRDEIAARVQGGPAAAGADDSPQPPVPSAGKAVIRFGGRVAAERRRRGWDTGELAARTGVTVLWLSRLENGNARVTLAEAAHLAAVLMISLDGLLGPCQQCGDSPPQGFTCNACGAGGGGG